MHYGTLHGNKTVFSVSDMVCCGK